MREESKHTITVVTQDQVVYQAFKQQLLNFFGEAINVEGYVLNEMPVLYPIKCKLVVVSTDLLIKKIRPYLTDDSKVFIAYRAINPQNIGELLRLYPGTNVLMVSNYMEMAYDAINKLLSLGVTHLKFIPFVPGVSEQPRGVSVACTPGLVHLVPEGIQKIINIGVRELDLSTIVTLQIDIGLPIEKVNYLSDLYINEIVKVTSKYYQEMEKSLKLNAQLEAVLNNINDGLIGIDQNGRIIMCNPSASKLLGFTKQDILNRDINLVFQEEKIDWQEDFKDNQIKVIKLGGKLAALSRHLVVEGHRILGSVYRIQSVSDIQELELEIRRQVNFTGHVAYYKFDHIIGSSLRDLVQIARNFAATDQDILVMGETGTGKELFVQAIHNASARHAGPFVAVNFAALPETLVESELFGYESGAFTGARKGGHIGFFEQAHTGTLFLDEIGDAPLHIQARILRVLEERRLMRLGGNKVIHVDVRVIAATNKDLQAMIKQNLFRADLYYRLHVLPLNIPPLRERKNDIKELIEEFLKRNRVNVVIKDSLMKYFYSYDWPGNIRELENILRYLCATYPGQEIDLSCLPVEMITGGKQEKLISPLEERIFTHQDKVLFYKFLAALKKCYYSRGGITRRGIRKILEEEGLVISDAKLKRFLYLLKSSEHINIGHTRQGSQLTPLGIKLIREIH